MADRKAQVEARIAEVEARSKLSATDPKGFGQLSPERAARFASAARKIEAEAAKGVTVAAICQAALRASR